MKYFSLCVLFLCACDVSSTDVDVGVPDATDATPAVDAIEDVAPDGVDVTEDDVMSTDVEEDSGEPDAAPTPECDPGERYVGDRCRKDHDRSCTVDADCRARELCEWRADDDPDRPGTCMYQIPEPVRCPGSPQCATNEGTLQAGFAMRAITPTGWETPRPGYTEGTNEWGFPRRFTGDDIVPSTFCDCGRDMICPPTEDYADCLSLGEYTGPDADGSEEDGQMQGAWLGGFGNSRLAQLCPEDWLLPTCEGAHCCVSPFAHDEMWARTTVLDQGDTRIAFVVVDTVGYFYSQVGMIFDSLDPALGIDWLLVSATHTHEAPDTLGQWGPGSFGASLPTTTGAEPMWMADIRDQIAASVEEAVADLAPTDVYAAHVHTGPHEFAIRDTRDPFIFDDRMTIVRFVADGADPTDPQSTQGVMVNWHSHPEAMGSNNVFTSSDFPHWVRGYIEQGFAEASDAGDGRVFPARPGHAGMATYISGSVGGLLNPLHREAVGRDGVGHSAQGYEKAHAIGERLADLALAALDVECEAAGDLGCAYPIEESLSFMSQEHVLDVTNVNFQTGGISLGIFDRPIYNWRTRDGSRGNSNMPKLLTAVTQLRLGEVVFQAFPGEPFPELTTGLHLDQMARDPIVGEWQDMNCGPDRLTRLSEDDPGERFGCMLDPNNPNPPVLENFPRGTPLAETLGGDYLVIVGLGNDQLGYLVPPYDHQIDPFVGELLQVDGDHYEETASVGNVVDELLEIVHALNAELIAP